MGTSVDVLIVGAGAAGMMAGIAARGGITSEGRPAKVGSQAPSVVLLDGTKRLGLKILVSGGGRCNVTNEDVGPEDFETDRPNALRSCLRELPASAVRTYFTERGCPLVNEPIGKLFPSSQRAQDILSTLRTALSECGAELLLEHEVISVERTGDRWRAICANGAVFDAARLILATGGKSLPKTGSRGFGFALAERLGLELSPTLPALTPIRLAESGPLHGLAGLTVPVLLSLVDVDATPDQTAGKRFAPRARAAGSLLVTHRGASGPAALDVSGACGLALQERRPSRLVADFWTLGHRGSTDWPYHDLDKLPGSCLRPELGVRPVPFETFLQSFDRTDSAKSLLNILSAELPRRLVSRLLEVHAIDGEARLPQVSKATWRRVYEAIVHCDLKLIGTDGYEKAEVTRGGVLLGELDRHTLESKRHPGLHLCGEVVNVTGRLGGFNFQWAWSSGYLAGHASQ
ncbi:MAG: aminoacetone oxidase family FAD-binding enzyme [Planctomycetota bacterium]